MKIAIFCEDRYKNNEQFNHTKEKNLEPYYHMQQILGEKNCITYDLLEKRDDKDDFILITWLPLTIFTIKDFLFLCFKFKKNKKYLFLKEPPVVAPFQYYRLVHYFFSRIYTWNDDLVDNDKYCKLIWQQSIYGFETKVCNYKEKKLLTLINGNKFSPWKYELYSERERAIRFFENNYLDDFDLYWVGWDKANYKQRFLGYTKYKSYKWKVDDKIATLAKYKFNICYENMNKINGYITEKIRDSFKAKSIPVYLWAENINSYIPANCFIDMRNFSDYHELYSFINSIWEDEYNQYIENITIFLKSKKSIANFSKKWANNLLTHLK